MEPLLGNHSSSSTTKAPIIGRFVLLLTLASAILLIVALTTPSLISTTGFGSIRTDKLAGDFGPFRACYRVGNTHECDTIDNDCQFEVTLIGTELGDVTTDVPVVENCRAWNAARAFLVIAALSACFAFLLQLIIACSDLKNGFANFLAFGLGMSAAICGIISMAIVIDRSNHDHAFTDANSVSLAYGFWCVVVGWALAFIGSLPWLANRK